MKSYSYKMLNKIKSDIKTAITKSSTFEEAHDKVTKLYKVININAAVQMCMIRGTEYTMAGSYVRNFEFIYK